MRRIIVPAVLAATLAATGAFAAEQATGVIKTWDATAHSITLADGVTYSVPDKFKAADFKTGEKVRISYDMKDGKHMATDVTVIK